MTILLIIGIIFLLLIGTLWYKIRTHSSFPLIFGMGLVSSAYFDILKLLIQYINSTFKLNLDYQISNIEFAIFSIFIVIVLGIYYFAPTHSERNIVRDTINQNGEIDQSGGNNTIEKVDNFNGSIRQQNE